MYQTKTLDILVNRLGNLAMNSTMNSKHAAGLILGNKIVGMSVNNATRESLYLNNILLTKQCVIWA